jgi:hypothetical protein
MPSIHCREADLARLGLKLTPDGIGLAPVSSAAAQSGPGSTCDWRMPHEGP